MSIVAATSNRLLPRVQVSKVVVEPYNSVFSLSHLVANSDETFFVDNEALYDICLHTLKLSAASFPDMNLLISAAMAGQRSPPFLCSVLF